KFNVESGGTAGGVGVNGRAGGAFTRNWAYRFGLRGKALGGMLASGQWSVVGENGPEMIRLRHPGRVFSNQQSQRLARNGAGGGGNVTINVYAGMGADGRKIGYEVVKALKDYQQSTGYQPLPITVKSKR